LELEAPCLAGRFGFKLEKTLVWGESFGLKVAPDHGMNELE